MGSSDDVTAPAAGRRPRVTVRHALRADLQDATASLVDAFAADPWFRWLYPEDASWIERATSWFSLVADRALSKGHTYVTADGAVMWAPPDVHFPADDDVAAAVGLLHQQIGERATDALGVIGALGSVFPDTPRFHCVFIGVRPRSQGRGSGGALLDRILTTCDAEGIPASLTSSNDANLPFYRAHGFREFAAVPIPGTGRSMRPMWRDPGRRG